MKTKITSIALTLLMLWSCSADIEEKVLDKKKIPVKLVYVEQQEISVPIHSSGVLNAKDELLLSFKTGGVIKNIFVKEGRHVNAGQLLAQLDLAEFSAYKKQAQAAFAKAERDLRRLENLYDEKVVTLEQKQNALSALEVAKANLQVAAFNEQHSKIFAPSNGKVLKTFADAAELISPGTPVLAFGSTDNAFVLKTAVTDRDIVKIQQGDSAEIHFDAYPEKVFKAFVAEISATTTPASSTYEVQLQLEKTPVLLFSGFIGKTTIYPQNTSMVSIIPVNALNEAREKTAYVYTINEKKEVVKEQIQIAFIMDNTVAFYNTDGISQIINEGNAYLYENSMVEIVD